MHTYICKTEVALRAILTCALAARQAIFMAPTTVLAAQVSAHTCTYFYMCVCVCVCLCVCTVY